MVGVAVERVAIGSGVSPFVGVIAASLGGTNVLAAENDHSSLLWPWVTNGCDVRLVPLGQLAEAIDGSTQVVAVSAVQSVTGEVADLDSIIAAARSQGCILIVDGTHGCGWLPTRANRCDALVCSAYKWLLSPRGTAFLVISEALRERVKPRLANWYAAGGAYGTFAGLPMPLPDTAARFDLSPAWFSWVGTAPALEVLRDIGIETIHAHDVGLANRFRAGLGLGEGNSAIVTTRIVGAEERLRQAGIRATFRPGVLRVSFHVYNGEEDVDSTLNALLS
jgi:selenocysteine lyase/cysteine desulfurase